MNIFRLDPDPEKAAQYHKNDHVLSAIHESAFMLSSAYRRHGPDPDFLFGETHTNHPVTLWAGDGRENFTWLYDYATAAFEEKKHRWGGSHGSYTGCIAHIPREPDCIPEGSTTQPIVGSPADYDIDGVVRAYRRHYIESVDPTDEYLNREPPAWLVDAEVVA